MAILEWHENTTGRYISGVSHGVFFGSDGVPIPWNGLISVTEKFQTNEPTPIYNSLGQKYHQYGNVAEKRHSIVCYTYPEEMEDYLGTEYVEHFGFVVDEKPPRRFDMAYRSDRDGYYELHILFNQMATFGDKTRATNTTTQAISNITMNLQGVRNEAFDTSHITLDSRNPITASVERVLFGTRNADGNLDNFLNADIEWVPQAINYAPTIEPDYDNPVMINSVTYPGVKDASKWNATNVIPYWDEGAEQLALHSVSPEEWTESKLSIPLDVSTPVDLKTSADINFGGMVDEEVGENLLSGGASVRLNGTDTRPNVSLIPLPDRMRVEIVPSVGFWNSYTFITSRILDEDFFTNIGETYIVSADVMASFSAGASARFLIDVRGSDKKIYLSHPGKITDTDGEWVRVHTVMVIPDHNSLNKSLFEVDGHNMVGGGWFEMRNVKLEKATSPTPYSPAPVDALHRRIIGTREPQVLSEQAPNVIGSQTVTLNSTISNTPQVDIYHNGPVGSDDVLVDNLMVVLQNYRGEFFDGNTKPKNRGERYRRVESESGYYTVYEHLQLKTLSEVGVHPIGSDLYELYGPETQLSTDGDQFTFTGPQATPIGDDEFEIDEDIY